MSRNRLTHTLLLIIGVYLVITLSRSIYDLTLKGKDLDVAQKRVENELAQNNELNQKLLDVKKPQFIEQQARDKLNMAKPGETVVVVPTEVLDPLAKINATISASFFDRPEKVPNWKRWWKLFF